MLGILSFLLSFFGGMPYLFMAIKGKIKPERTTWGIWTLILVLSIAAYRAEGGQESILFLFGDLAITGSIFAVSIFKGKGATDRLDLSCLILAITGLLLWQLTDNPGLQIIGVVTADMLALIPTIKKALDDPEGDSSITFFFSAAAALMAITSIKDFNFILVFYPFYLYSINLITGVVISSAKYVSRKKGGDLKK
jgi:hypothetical protein